MCCACSRVCGLGEWTSVRAWCHVMWSQKPYNEGDKCGANQEIMKSAT